MRHSVLITLIALLTPCTHAAPPFAFTDSSQARGIGAYLMSWGQGGGVSAADYDGDGDIDLFVPNAVGRADQLYRNDGLGKFDEVAAALGVAGLDQSRVALFFDYDGDHDLDLLVASDREGEASTYHLHRQEPHGGFTDVTVEAGLFQPMAPRFQPIPIPQRGGLCAGDVNGDGWLDLYCALWNGAPQLFVNDGDGTFTDVTAAAGVDDVLWYGHQPMMADLDGDGHTDIYAAIDFLWNALWINQGDGTFADLAPGAGADNAMNDMGMALGDVDNDGDLDVYVTNIFNGFDHNILLRNDSRPGAPAFAERSMGFDVDYGGWGWGTTMLDADLDGWIDIAATNGWVTPQFVEDRSVFFWNRQGARDTASLALPFKQVNHAVRFDDTNWGSCLVSADLDRDGDPDLVQTCNRGPLRVLENRRLGAAGRWLVVRPRMDGPNHFAIGARVRVVAGDLRMMRPITAGTSYLGQEPAEAHFGVGDARRVDVTIEWPDGTSTTRRGVPTSQVLDVARGR